MQTKTVTMTPEAASKILETQLYERQRPLKQDHVNFLAEEMRSGRFTTNTIKFAVLPDGSKHLINGQHTLWAVLESGKAIELPVVYTQCKNRKDLDRQYSVEDIGSRRTIGDMIRAFDLSSDFGLSTPYIKCLGAAVWLINNDFNPNHIEVSRLDVAKKMAGWVPEMKLFVEIIADSALAKVLCRRDTLAIALTTLKYCEGKATEFWKQVAQDDGLHKGDPRKTLHNFLRDNMNQTSVGKRSRIATEYGLRAAAQCWNAYFDVRSLDRIAVRDTAAKVVLRGTIYR